MADTEKPKTERPKEYWEERPAELEPTEFKEGFTFKTILGALFVGFLMMPGSIYLGLMVGSHLGPAAEWTTIILFTEIARRSFTTLRRQEIYVIFYMAAGLMTMMGVALSGGPFASLIMQQYLVQSPAADQFGIADQIPTWVVPHADSPAIINRTFLHHDWLIPITLLLISNVLARMEWIGMGYILFRTTSDIERLPFPLAPIAAQGATALAEVTREEESWRWPVFSTGAMIGLTYGLIYVAVPVITGAFLTTPVMLIKIPFIDLTSNTEGAFPAAMAALGTDLGLIITGFVLPFPIVAGNFIMSFASNFFLAPTLYRIDADRFFPTWQPGMNLIQTELSTGLDLWLSVGIGVSVAIAILGLYNVFKALVFQKAERAKMKSELPPGRGDFPISVAATVWLLSATGYVVMCHLLVPDFPLWILLGFGFIWTPINSYVSARMVGYIGRGVTFPYVAQASFILTKYPKVDIWFAPIPLHDRGAIAQKFREVELTGTKITSVIKAEIFVFFLMFLCSFIFWSFFWRLGPIPSISYPYAQTWWPLHATWTCLWATANQAGQGWLLDAIKFPYIGAATSVCFILYWILGAFKIPVMWFYGLVTGIGMNTWSATPMFVGAILGRYYFARRFGLHRWQLYTPVLAAGYACGMGLMGMSSIALGIVFKAVRVLPF